MPKISYLLPKHFADAIGVNPSSVTRKKDKLITGIFFGKWMIKLCNKNVSLFPTAKPSEELQKQLGCSSCKNCKK